MSDVSPPATAGHDAGFESALRSARLVSGLILMAFVVLHLANHALILVSLETAERARLWFLALWRNPLGTLLLYGSVAIHAGLALFSLYRRRTLAMPMREWAQVSLGLLIPMLIAEHVGGTRIVHDFHGLDDTYEFVVRSLWIVLPAVGARQAVAVVVIWAHGCLGLYFWLRFRSWYAQAAPWLLVLAVLFPVLALLGFARAGQELSGTPPSYTLDHDVVVAAVVAKDAFDQAIYAGFAVLVAAVLGARIVRDRIERRSVVRVRYADGPSIRVPKGYSVLDASRVGGIPHYAVCGGRGRCSTCRIRVVDGLAGQPPPGPIEATTLRRIHAEDGIRLACQLRPTHDLVVAPLLKPYAEERKPAAGGAAAEPGHEQVVAVMFCDMRGFTRLADQRLPFDVVFLLNRYFAIIGDAVEAAGGRLDKFIGDGALALFGLAAPPGEACRQAIAAATAIVQGVGRLSDDLAAELRGSIRIAIGIHVGQAIVGTMGYGRAMGVTAIGDAVNIGSRLEAAAKEFEADIVVSQAAAKLSGLDFSGVIAREIEIRGRAQPLEVLVVPRNATISLSPQAERG